MRQVGRSKSRIGAYWSRERWSKEREGLVESYRVAVEVCSSRLYRTGDFSFLFSFSGKGKGRVNGAVMMCDTAWYLRVSSAFDTRDKGSGGDERVLACFKGTRG